MAIQHKDIQDPDLHEPKGIATAAAGTVYRATGNGTGTFRKDRPTDLQGISTAPAGYALHVGADGASFQAVNPHAVGSITIVGNEVGFSLSQSTDPKLNNNNDYQLLTGASSPWQGDSTNEGVVSGTDRLTVGANGVYRVDFWAAVKTFPTDSALVAFKYRRNGTLFGADKVLLKSNGIGDAGSVSAFGIASLQAGDYIQLTVASSAAGVIQIESARLTLTLMKAT